MAVLLGSITHLFSLISANISANSTLPKVDSLMYIYVARIPFKVIQGHQFGTTRKHVCNFVLVNSTKLHPILHSFQAIAGIISQILTHLFGVNPLTLRP